MGNSEAVLCHQGLWVWLWELWWPSPAIYVTVGWAAQVVKQLFQGGSGAASWLAILWIGHPWLAMIWNWQQN